MDDINKFPSRTFVFAERLKWFTVPLLLISTPTSDPLQVHQDTVPGHHVASAEGASEALVLGHDVRVRRRQHAAAAGDLPGVCASAGPAALHHDPGEPSRDAAV